MDAETLEGLRGRTLAGDAEATAILNDALHELGGMTARYLRGDHAGVWAELVALGARVFEPELHVHAWAIAWETMWRARQNLTRLISRYTQVGYRLGNSETPIGPPALTSALDAIEDHAGGPIPLSMRAFWAVVGSVDLTQSESQRRHGWLEEGVSDIESLGDDDPLYVDSAETVLAGCESLAKDGYFWGLSREEGRLYVEFAPDCFHKNGVSGGENYHLWIPEPAADFRIIGDVCPATEWTEGGGQHFVSALRRSFEGGGFRGSVDFDEEDPDSAGWRPWKVVHGELAEGLLPL